MLLNWIQTEAKKHPNEITRRSSIGCGRRIDMSRPFDDAFVVPFLENEDNFIITMIKWPYYI